MQPKPLDQYLDLMKVARARLDVIQSLSDSPMDNYSKAEIAAFHGRKIIEAIAFGCLIAIKNGLKEIPADAEGQYNAEKIFKKLIRKGIDVLPSPSEIREATEAEQIKYNVKITVDGIPERRITKEELIRKYQRMHEWLHELNPYTKDSQDVFYGKNQEQLWKDLAELKMFLMRHFISINGAGFFCTLQDEKDNLTKAISLSKIAEL